MIKNILTGIFSGESSPTSDNKPASPTTAPPTQSFGISSVPDSFETTASKGSAQFDLGLVPNTQNSDGTQKQQDLLHEEEKLREEQKKFEEMTQDKGKDFFGSIGGLFGDDKGLVDYQTQTTLNTYNEAEKSSQHISQTVDDTSDDVKKHFG